MMRQTENISEVEQLRLRVIELEREIDGLRSAVPMGAPRSNGGGRENPAACHDLNDRELYQDTRLRLLADAVPAAIAYVDRSEHYRFVNQAYAARYGVRGKDHIGKRIDEVLGPKIYAANKDNINAALSGQTPTFEHEILVREGQKERVSVQYIPDVEPNGNVQGFFAVVDDLTERRATEDALRESQAQFQAFMDNMPGEMWLKDLDGRYLLVNRFAEDLYGRSAESIRGLMPHDIFPEELADDIAAHDQRVRDSKTVTSEEFEAETEDGLHNRLATKFPILNEAGDVTGLGAIVIDITAQKRQAEALRRTTELFKESERLAGLGHWEWDEIEDRCVYCSEELARLHGMSVDEFLRQAVSTEDDLRMVHPEDREGYRNVVDKMKKEKCGFEVEYRLVRPDGDVLEIREVAKPVLDAQGRLVRSVGYAQDITAQKRAERSLRESEALLIQAADMADLGHWVWDEVLNRCVYGSEGIARLSGVTVDEYLERFGTMEALLENVHPEDRRRYESFIAEAKVAGEPYDIEFRYWSVGGEYRYYRERGEPVFDDRGKLIRTIGIAQDITKDKQIEEALRKTTELFKQSERLARLGHWEWDEIEDRSIYCSEELARLHGMSVDEFLSQACSTEDDLRVVHPDDSEKYRGAVDWMREHKLGYELEYRLQRPDGSVLEVREFAEPILDDDGRLVRSVGSVQDITKQKQSERSLRESESLLNQAARMADLGHWIWDEVADRCVYCSEGLARLNGVTVEEYFERFGTIEGLFVEMHPEDRQRYESTLIDAKENGEPYEVEFRDKSLDGNYRYYREYGEPVFDGNGKHIRTIGILQDITKYKDVEAALRKSEAALAEAQRIAKVGNWEWSIETNELISCSEEYARIHGVPPESIGEHLDRQMEQVVHPDDRERVIDAFRHADEEGLDYEIEYRIVQPSGEIRHVHEIGEAVFDEAGRPIAHTGTVQDITERRQAEEALRESEARLWAIMNNAPAFIFLKDLAGRHILSSQTSERLIGGGSSIVGKTSHDLFTSEYAIVFAEHDREVIRTGRAIEREIDAPTSEGLRTFLVVKFPVPGPDGRISAVGSVATDITERKRAEEALRKSEAALAKAQRLARIGHWEWSIDGDILVSCSEEYAHIYGIPHEDIIEHQKAQQNEEIHADDRDRVLDIFERAEQEGLDYDVEYRIFRPDGEVRHIHEIAEAVFDGTGRPVGHNGTVQDITERKLAEEALRRSEEKFRALIEGSIQGIYIAREWKPLFANQACAEMFGYDNVEEFTAIASIGEHIAPHERERLKGYRDARLRGEEAPLRHIAEHVRKDGSTLWLESVNKVVDWDEGPAIQATLMDITERKKAEEGLRQSEARFRAFVDNAPVEIYLKDLDGRVVSPSQESEKHFGPVSGRTAYNLFPKEYADRQVAQDRAVIESNGTIAREQILPTKQGLRTFMIVKFPVPGSGGRIAAIGAVSTDITERKEAEEALQQAHDELERRVEERTKKLYEMNIALQVEIEEHRRTEYALRESETRIRAIADASPSLISYIDTKRRYQFSNAGYQRWFGISSEDCLGRHVKDVIGKENYAKCESYIERVLAGESVRYQLLTTQGYHADVNYIPDIDDRDTVQGYYALIHDITDIKRSEAALHESRALLATIIDAAPIGINVKGPDGRYVFMNRYQADVYGVAAESADGKTASELVSPKYGAYIEGLDQRVIEAGTTLPYFEEETSDKSGQGRTWLTTKVPIEGENDKLRYIVSVSLDITDLKSREHELRQAQKMEAVGQLTSGIAHDFNNLILVIKGNLMQLEDRSTGDTKVERSVASIKTAASLASDLTRSLLAFSRQQSLEPTVIDPCETIKAINAILSRTIGDKIQIIVSCDDDLWPILIDGGQLETALLNLALNARDAMPEGGELTISVANLKQRRRHRSAESSPPNGDYVELRVSDTGIGMPPEVVEHCFEPFYTTKPSESGTGLGLSMVHGFIKQSDGFIDIESEQDKGTTVAIYLPRAEHLEFGESPTPSMPDEIKGGQETILVTEDDAEVRRVTVSLLNKLGYRTVEAANGNTALEILAREPDIDLLFTDIVMPGGMSGYDLAARSKEQRPDLKVVFCSGHAKGEVPHENRVITTAPLIPKPFHSDDLGRIVRGVLDERGEVSSVQ